MNRPNLIAIALFALMAAPAFAQPSGAPAGEHPHHHGPPPAAFDACKDKKADDACEVTLHDHTMPGTCAATPDQRLACRPLPPPEAIDACQGKADGDSCTVQGGPHSFEGTCRKGPDGGGKLACAPAR